MNNPTQAPELTTGNQASGSTSPPKFVQIPHALIRDRKLGRSDLVVYGIVQWFTKLHYKKCFASNETIADIAGIAITNARRSLRKLEQQGYVRCIYKAKTKRHRLEIALTPDLIGAEMSANEQTGHLIDEQLSTAGLSPAPIQIASQDNLDYHRRTQRNINKDINSNKKTVELLLASFGSINEVYQSGSPNVTQRRAMTNLLGRHSANEIKAMIDYIAAHQGELYFPSVSSPVQLEQKWSNIEAKRKAEKRPAPKATNLLSPSSPDKYNHVVIT